MAHLRTRSPRGRWAVALAGPMLVAVLAGCGSSDDGAKSTSESSKGASETSGASDGRLTTETLVPALMKAVDGKESVHMTMSLAGPQEMSMEGDAQLHEEDPVMSLTMEGGGMPGVVEVRLVDGLIYASVPGLAPEGKFVKIDPEDANDPLAKAFGDLSGTMDPRTTFDAFEAGVKDVEFIGEEPVGGDQMSRYRVTVDAAAAMKAQGQTAPQDMPKTIDYDLWLDADNLMRKMTFELPGGISMDLAMSRWGEPVKVGAPKAADIVEPPATTS
ncbi:MAG: LppX_LprAFG lipoprotein [Propionibacteriales bacterium]|nr:LppX_LprAFG lipoprotein [Propionibacteriales bacterium]